ncbi:MAG: hypothetical protein EHM41_03340, partial [Chloroflexi bacterium]
MYTSFIVCCVLIKIFAALKWAIQACLRVLLEVLQFHNFNIDPRLFNIPGFALRIVVSGGEHTMTRGKVTLRAIFCAIVPIMLLLSACSSSGASFSPTITQESGVSVDPLFREFYEMLGGKDILGPAISPTFSFANHTYQYTDKACM